MLAARSIWLLAALHLCLPTWPMARRMADGRARDPARLCLFARRCASICSDSDSDSQTGANREWELDLQRRRNAVDCRAPARAPVCTDHTHTFRRTDGRTVGRDDGSESDWRARMTHCGREIFCSLQAAAAELSLRSAAPLQSAAAKSSRRAKMIGRMQMRSNERAAQRAIVLGQRCVRHRLDRTLCKSLEPNPYEALDAVRRSRRKIRSRSCPLAAASTELGK